MKTKKKLRYINSFTQIAKTLLLILLTISINNCSDFLDVDLVDSEIESDIVFSDEASTNAAMGNVYTKLRDESFINGSSINRLLGLYTDQLGLTLNFDDDFFDNSLQANDFDVRDLWDRNYNVIFDANTVIEGVQNSDALDEDFSNRILGEALVVRALIHSYFAGIFGDTPYIVTTDFEINNSVSRIPVDEVYLRAIEDINRALPFLSITNDERIRVDAIVAHALLARLHLFLENWTQAEINANIVIDALEWETNIEDVFLANSSGSIFQLKPFEDGQNTSEANTFVIQGSGTATLFQSVLTPDLLDAFEPDDLRFENWVKETTVVSTDFIHPFKYKAVGITSQTQEYSVVMRLAEQYLIRAEARAQMGNITGAQADINLLRTRAGLPNTTANSLPTLLDAIIQERRIELFSEHGFRFFDLKRTNRINSVLLETKPGWNPEDALFPIPLNELLLNSNLAPQNPGY